MRLVRGAELGWGLALLFAAPFCAVGIVATVLALRAALAADWAQAGFAAIFALSFGGAGFGLMAAMLWARRKEREAERLEDAHPDEPWLWKPDWAAGRIPGSSRGRMIFAWVFALFWNLISGPSAYLAVREAMEQGKGTALLALAFPAVGIGLLSWAIRATLRYRRFGLSVFRMASVPGVIGRALRGVIVINADVRPEDGFTLTLTSAGVKKTRSGREASTYERVRWQEEQCVREIERLGRRATAVPVAFQLPRDARQTNETDPDGRITWRLEARATLPGIDYDTSFEVPVFRTAESDRPLGPEERAELAVGVADLEQPPTSRISVTAGARRTEIYFPPARNPGPAILLTVFFGIWPPIAYALPRLGAPSFFSVLLGIFSLILILAVINLWFATTRVILSPSGVQVTRGILGVGPTRTIAADEIADVVFGVGMTSGRRIYYDIDLIKADGKKVSAGRWIKDKRETQWLVGKMKEALGLKND